jgi:hypothetical protein
MLWAGFFLLAVAGVGACVVLFAWSRQRLRRPHLDEPMGIQEHWQRALDLFGGVLKSQQRANKHLLELGFRARRYASEIGETEFGTWERRVALWRTSRFLVNCAKAWEKDLYRFYVDIDNMTASMTAVYDHVRERQPGMFFGLDHTTFLDSLRAMSDMARSLIEAVKPVQKKVAVEMRGISQRMNYASTRLNAAFEKFVATNQLMVERCEKLIQLIEQKGRRKG